MLKYKLSPEAIALGIQIESVDGTGTFDIYATEAVTIFQGQQVTVKTGLSISVPPDYVGFIKDRNSMALRKMRVHGGVVHPSYLEEIQVILENCAVTHFHIEAGDKIAQLLIVPCLTKITKADW